MNWRTEVSYSLSIHDFKYECEKRDGWELVAARIGDSRYVTAIWKRLAGELITDLDLLEDDIEYIVFGLREGADGTRSLGQPSRMFGFDAKRLRPGWYVAIPMPTFSPARVPATAGGRTESPPAGSASVPREPA